MHALILWCGFLGGWLLFAGPVYQASLELAEVDLERDEISDAMHDVEPPRRSSPWWWLLPPVAYLIRRREGEAFRQRVHRALSREHLGQFVEFQSKATGWVFVAMGALLIATKETYELGEHHAWPGWLVLLVVVAMAVLSGLNTAVRARRSRALLDDPGGTAAR
ncbi:hypothetical protein [Phycicoccus sp.]|uniref:hypothetical protein n=1 Tax=Phycicoccus sp. TaxID=1902410 RepID=UPI002C34CA4D|nr:hypothetical protein [Phycicoccus sp.]HMM95268.1 hypothetical protein [Phycicoccus sp.]